MDPILGWGLKFLGYNRHR